MKGIDSSEFLAREGETIRLDERPTLLDPLYESRDDYQDALAAHVKELSALQEVFYASNSYSVLLIFQAMDAAGKDSVIRHVMSGINPQGCQVYSFKHPSMAELDHDFLWRTNCALPERGRIGIFNRSYYEEVLIVRVHPEILSGQKIPEDLLNGGDVWEKRYRSINDLERHLYANGTRIIKFFLHLSRDEQRRRFLRRIDKPDKNWKIFRADIEERRHWDSYMSAYEECLSATSTKRAPWFIVPADDKKNTRLIVSRIILDTFRALDVSYPEVSEERRKELRELRAMLEADG